MTFVKAIGLLLILPKIRSKNIEQLPKLIFYVAGTLSYIVEEKM